MDSAGDGGLGECYPQSKRIACQTTVWSTARSGAPARHASRIMLDVRERNPTRAGAELPLHKSFHEVEMRLERIHGGCSWCRGGIVASTPGSVERPGKLPERKALAADVTLALVHLF